MINKLKEKSKEIEIWGVGQENMKRAGVNLLVDTSSISVVGLSEIFKALPGIFFTYSKILNFLKREKLDILVLVDYPGLNVRIAKKAKGKNIKVIYYIPPIVWGRKKNRAEKLAKLTDHIITFLPQDYEIYKNSGANVTLVEHPLLKIVKPALSKEKIIEKFSLSGKYPVIGLLPGSRIQEVKNLLADMLSAGEIIKRKYPSAKFLIPVAAPYLKEIIEKICNNYSLDLTIQENFTYEIMSICDVLIVCSGTATLEAALMEVPMIIVYRISKITEFAAKMVLEKHIIGLPNIILGKMAIPELLQKNVNPEEISRICLKILEDRNFREKMKEDLAKVKELIKGRDAISTVAEIILNEINLN